MFKKLICLLVLLPFVARADEATVTVLDDQAASKGVAKADEAEVPQPIRDRGYKLVFRDEFTGEKGAPRRLPYEGARSDPLRCWPS